MSGVLRSRGHSGTSVRAGVFCPAGAQPAPLKANLPMADITLKMDESTSDGVGTIQPVGLY